MNFSDIKKILIIRLSSLGDILLATPLIRTIKKQYPYIQIDFVMKEQYTDLLKFNPYISNLLIYNPESVSKTRDVILQNKYDLIIDLQKNFRSKALAEGTGANILKFNKRSLDKFLLVSFKINRLTKAPPIPQRYASDAGIQLDNEGLDLFTNGIISVLPEQGHRYIGLAPGARHFTKRWPEEYYAELGHSLQRDGYTVVLFGGKDDKELCARLSKAIENSINLCSDNDILQTAADMKLCKAVVCNDSGLMHTACAVRVPVLSIFGSTVKEFGFAPYNSRSLVLENKLLSCRPCSHIGRSRCPKGHFKCMLEISPVDAYKNLMDLLS